LKNRKSLRHKIPAITNFFGVGHPTKVTDAGGDANANFFVETDGGEYFVKVICEPHTRSSKLKEAVYVEYLSRHGIPAVRYLSGRDGSAIFEDEDVMAMAQHKIPGSCPRVTIANALHVGRLLGRMSLIPAAEVPDRHGWFGMAYVENSLVRLKRDFSSDPDARRIISAHDACSDFVENVLPHLPQSIVHTDMHSENVLFNNRRLVAVVDWEDSSVAASLLDFVSSVAYWCRDDDVGGPSMYRAFYESYTAERPFTLVEENSLDDCLKYVGVMQTMWRFLNYGDGDREGLLWALDFGNRKMSE